MAAKTKTKKPIEYPSRDGRPMWESDCHRRITMNTLQVLDGWFENQPMVYVSGSLLIYYVRGDIRSRLAPDTFVVFGVPKINRNHYLLWEEKKRPAVVIEFTSKKTRREDFETKWEIYRDVLKVKEYFLYDSRGDYLNPRLHGYRLRRGEFERMAMIEDRYPRRLASKFLGLHLADEGEYLRFIDPETGNRLLTNRELEYAAEDAIRAHRLAEEVKRLRLELQMARAQGPTEITIKQEKP